MNYCYEIKPKGSYVISRNCAKCGCKMNYVNTNNFRVNANGNQIDVWLIYQCEKCKHTYNLTIYERVKPSSIDRKEYDAFLKNEEALAIQYGNDKTLFSRNQAEIDNTQIQYDIIRREKRMEEGTMLIRNPYGIKIRSDKVLAEILKMSRNKIKQLVNQGDIFIISKSVDEIIYGISMIKR